MRPPRWRPYCHSGSTCFFQPELPLGLGRRRREVALHGVQRGDRIDCTQRMSKLTQRWMRAREERLCQALKHAARLRRTARGCFVCNTSSGDGSRAEHGEWGKVVGSPGDLEIDEVARERERRVAQLAQKD